MAGMFPSSVISSVSSSDEISVTVSSITSVTFEKIESISLHGAMGGQPSRSVCWILHKEVYCPMRPQTRLTQERVRPSLALPMLSFWSISRNTLVIIWRSRRYCFSSRIMSLTTSS